jgi:hypothetical protein
MNASRYLGVLHARKTAMVASGGPPTLKRTGSGLIGTIFFICLFAVTPQISSAYSLPGDRNGY